MGAGRPTLYKPIYCKKIIKYFDRPITVKKKETVYDKIRGTTKEIIYEVVNTPPTLFGFAAHIKVNTDTIKEWAKKHPEFSAAVRQAKDMAAQFIVDVTMTNKSPPNFAQFMMTNLSDWRVNQNVDHTSSDGSMGNGGLTEKQEYELAKRHIKKYESKLSTGDKNDSSD